MWWLAAILRGLSSLCRWTSAAGSEQAGGEGIEGIQSRPIYHKHKLDPEDILVTDNTVDDRPADDEPTLENYIKAELKKSWDKRYFEEVLGPALFGPGNFEVFYDERGWWDIRPVEGYVPAVPMGILNTEVEDHRPEDDGWQQWAKDLRNQMLNGQKPFLGPSEEDLIWAYQYNENWNILSYSPSVRSGIAKRFADEYLTWWREHKEIDEYLPNDRRSDHGDSTD